MGKRRLVLRLSDDNWLNVVAIVVAILGLNNCSSIGEDDDDDNNIEIDCYCSSDDEYTQANALIQTQMRLYLN